jgi:flagellin
MSVRIGTNISSLQAQRTLRTAQSSVELSSRQMSSGSRITKSADDAAGLSISEHMKSEIRSLSAANRNAQDGISVIQVAEGAFGEVGNMLTRLRELAIQSSSDTVGRAERGMISLESEALLNEIDRIADTTEYNGVKLLRGDRFKLDVQIGTKGDPNSRIVIDTENLATSSNALGAGGVNLNMRDSSRRSLGMIDQAINWLNETRSHLGAAQNRLDSIARSQIDAKIEISAGNSRIRDTDYANAATENTRAKIQQDVSTSVLAQANVSGAVALKLLG